MWVWSLASLSGLRIQCCYELQGRLQMRLRFGIAMAVDEAGNCSSNLTLSWELPYAKGAILKKKKKKVSSIKIILPVTEQKEWSQEAHPGSSCNSADERQQWYWKWRKLYRFEWVWLCKGVWIEFSKLLNFIPIKSGSRVPGVAQRVKNPTQCPQGCRFDPQPCSVG